MTPVLVAVAVCRDVGQGHGAGDGVEPDALLAVAVAERAADDRHGVGLDGDDDRLAGLGVLDGPAGLRVDQEGLIGIEFQVFVVIAIGRDVGQRDGAVDAAKLDALVGGIRRGMFYFFYGEV